jgi:hypothetical protein
MIYEDKYSVCATAAAVLLVTSAFFSLNLANNKTDYLQNDSWAASTESSSKVDTAKTSASGVLLTLYGQFNIQQFYVLPTRLFTCFVWIWDQTAIISLYSINWMVIIIIIIITKYN